MEGICELAKGNLKIRGNIRGKEEEEELLIRARHCCIIAGSVNKHICLERPLLSPKIYTGYFSCANVENIPL